MTRLLLALPILALAAACATSQRPYAPIQNIRYQAMGTAPFWYLAIGDERIVLRTSEQVEAVWPRTLPRTENGVRTWQSGDGTAVISIEARPGPCASESGQAYEDHVRVRLSGRELTGCGGRLMRSAAD